MATTKIMRQKPKSPVLTMLVFSLTFFPAFNAKAITEYDEISKCFWIYASIHELGREIKSQELLSFTEPRIRWYYKFLSKNQENKIFATAFELDAEQRKLKALSIKNRMKQAMATKNHQEYSSIVNDMLQCDKTTNMSTKLIPKLINE